MEEFRARAAGAEEERARFLDPGPRCASLRGSPATGPERRVSAMFSDTRLTSPTVEQLLTLLGPGRLTEPSLPPTPRQVLLRASPPSAPVFREISSSATVDPVETCLCCFQEESIRFFGCFSSACAARPFDGACASLAFCSHQRPQRPPSVAILAHAALCCTMSALAGNTGADLFSDPTYDQ